MKEEELIKIWKSSPEEESVRLEISSMINDMQSNIDIFLEAKKGRNTLIKIIVIFVFPVFGMMAYTTPYVLSKIGAIMVLLSFAYVIIRLRNVKKLNPRSYSESYIDYLYKIKKYLRAEMHFWNNTFYQSALPCMIGAILFRMGSFKDIQDSIIRIAVALGLGIGGYFFHRFLVKKLFAIRLKKVEKLINALKE